MAFYGVCSLRLFRPEICWSLSLGAGHRGIWRGAFAGALLLLDRRRPADWSSGG
ncbi:MAG: hypothetical protein ACRDRB_25730 [Pseudonocardiaceae bacterium]